MTLFIKILIGVQALSAFLSVALIGEKKKVTEYTVGAALFTLVFSAIIIYGLFNWI